MVGAEDEAILLKMEVAEEEMAGADGVDAGLLGVIGGKRVVMAVDDGDAAGGEDGAHGGGLVEVNADGKKALPADALGGGGRLVGIEMEGGDADCLHDGAGGDKLFIQKGGVGDDGDGLDENLRGIGGRTGG